MEILIRIGMIILAVLLIYALLRLLTAPLRLAAKLLLNALFGFAALFVFNFLGGFIGVDLGMNWINALVVGTLGIPGVILLLLVKYFF